MARTAEARSPHSGGKCVVNAVWELLLRPRGIRHYVERGILLASSMPVPRDPEAVLRETTSNENK